MNVSSFDTRRWIWCVAAVSGADWPYSDSPQIAPPLAPSWRCPEAICECAPSDQEETLTFSVILRESDGERMPGARCRVWVNGRIINEDEPYADGGGWLTVEVPRHVEWVFVEWAPAATPVQDLYPHRGSYFIDARVDDEREAGRRRLHNLGFSLRRTMEQNIRDYQGEYGRLPLTGKLEDIAVELENDHDFGAPPARRSTPITGDEAALSQLEGGGAGGSGGGDLQDGAGPQATPSGSKMNPRLLPTVVDVLTDPVLTGHFEFARIRSTATGRKDGKKYEAHFWIMTDGYKWIVPKTCTTTVSQWCAAITAYTFVEDVMLPGERTWRLPTTVLECDEWCSLVKHKQDSLELVESEAEPKRPLSVGCALPTTHLFKLRFQQAPQGGLQMPNISVRFKTHTLDSNTFNQKVNKVAKTRWGTKAGTPRILADPAKIWAIDNMMDRPNYKLDNGTPRKRVRIRPGECRTVWEPTDRAAVNYGYHVKGKSPLQPPGRCHGKTHHDYSQLLVAVAGWCELRELGKGAWKFEFTERIYRDDNLAPLATGGAPIYKSQYGGTP